MNCYIRSVVFLCTDSGHDVSQGGTTANQKAHKETAQKQKGKKVPFIIEQKKKKKYASTRPQAVEREEDNESDEEVEEEDATDDNGNENENENENENILLDLERLSLLFQENAVDTSSWRSLMNALFPRREQESRHQQQHIEQVCHLIQQNLTRLLGCLFNKNCILTLPFFFFFFFFFFF
ncbi:hypothetical protein RFI_04728 [Reticulomyxa filosa]|uniref:Uncharacterized protein n=1 Tax=Reticulomyxa filosa TaxID=46433 RepID=X6P1I5_RETFI|nr:hypothetical protein RFI_04728 [Reticulomyxa filosa]|eukprot:ETO32390.1 hypothetical protein RFI_04728 [Reticulomyxa filosa]